jgi:hypothetical protein
MPITNIPYSYTLDTAHANPPWHMDAIHVQQLYRLCERIQPRVVVEVGSYMGCSTSAFAEAMRDGFVDKLFCYDLQVQPELITVLNHGIALGHGQMEVNKCAYPSAPIYADLILIDADHEAGCPLDVLAAVTMGCPHIVLHDHNCINVGLGCRGVSNSANLLKASHDYTWHEDIQKRPDMWTHRGLFYAYHNSEWPFGGWRDEDLP